MNAEVVLQVFLPYHQSPNFPRMLSILTIPKTSRYFAPFDPLIKNAQPLPRSYITQSISPSRDKSLRLLMDIAGMVQVALNDNVVHRGLLAFWSATMVELIESERAGKGVGEGLVKVLVEAFVGILETTKGGQDVNVSRPHTHSFTSADDLGGSIPSTHPPHSLHTLSRWTISCPPLSSPYPIFWCRANSAHSHFVVPLERASGLGGWLRRKGLCATMQSQALEHYPAWRYGEVRICSCNASHCGCVIGRVSYHAVADYEQAEPTVSRLQVQSCIALSHTGLSSRNWSLPSLPVYLISGPTARRQRRPSLLVKCY